MSFGSISYEAHSNLAIAMNKLEVEVILEKVVKMKILPSIKTEIILIQL